MCLQDFLLEGIILFSLAISGAWMAQISHRVREALPSRGAAEKAQCLLHLPRTWVWIPAPTWQLTSVPPCGLSFKTLRTPGERRLHMSPTHVPSTAWGTDNPDKRWVRLGHRTWKDLGEKGFQPKKNKIENFRSVESQNSLKEYTFFC